VHCTVVKFLLAFLPAKKSPQLPKPYQFDGAELMKVLKRTWAGQAREREVGLDNKSESSKAEVLNQLPRNSTNEALSYTIITCHFVSTCTASSMHNSVR
jgi:hypothetical protein